MPELPEVETICQDLAKVLPGRKFIGIKAEYEPAIFPNVNDFFQLIGKKTLDVRRRGKFLIINFEHDFVLTLHLRMSGRLLIRDERSEPMRFERTRLDFEDLSLRFLDSRKFGKIWLSTRNDFEQITGIKNLGVEPLSKDFTYKKFRDLLLKKKSGIKKILLDQSLIAGIGNIYADEACFYAGLKPDKLISKLSGSQLNDLYNSIIYALKQGIENRGTSISDFADAFGIHGQNQELLYVYGRKGQNCLRCSSEIVKIKYAGRGTHYCPKCQC